MPHAVRAFRLALLTLLLLPGLAAAQALQTPAQFLGYELGERFTQQHRLIDYFEHVAEVRPNVELVQYGETYEGRPLVAAFLSSAANMANLDAIRQSNLARTGLVDGTPDADQPAIVWLSYNVHGNESVSSEAAIATLYDLANPDDARTQAWLENTVVVIDPMENPDGRERYVHWYQQMRGAQFNPEPEAREHSEPWPGGRTNHYYFDLNRDWAWQTQKESQARTAIYQRWMPHVHVDLHEQGVNSPYYFAPAAGPFHTAITEWQRDFQTRIGENHARYFDAQGWLYFTREVFDLFYPSYGDTWPTFNGAIGMTYEQGGSGRAGLGVVTALGDTLTLRNRIDHHHTTSLSTVEITAQTRERVLREFTDYFARSTANPPTDYAAFVISQDNPAQKIAALTDLLDNNQIRYGTATAARSGNGFDYMAGTNGTVRVQPGDLVVPTAQPKAVLTSVLFEPQSTLVDSVTYDITAWALPYVYGLAAVAAEGSVPHRAGFTPAAANVSGAGQGQPYAWLAEWNAFADAQLLAELIKREVRVRFAEDAFEMNGRTWNRGTLIVTRRNNEAFGSRLAAELDAAQQVLRRPGALVPVTTGYVPAGRDFGSSGINYIGMPKVAMLAGDAAYSGALGELWHYFDQQLGYPITLIHADDFGFAPLDDYDVLILPSGNYGRVLDDDGLGHVRDWVRAGGTLVAMESAAGFLAGKNGFALKRKERPDSAADSLRRYENRVRESISGSVPGAIFKARLDDSHPLAFGYSDHYFTLKRSSAAYDLLGDGWNVVTLGEDGARTGFVGARAQQPLSNSLVAGVQPLGRGEVVYFVDGPIFRAFWENGKLMLANAIFMVGK